MNDIKRHKRKRIQEKGEKKDREKQGRWESWKGWRPENGRLKEIGLDTRSKKQTRTKVLYKKAKLHTKKSSVILFLNSKTFEVKSKETFFVNLHYLLTLEVNYDNGGLLRLKVISKFRSQMF